MRPTVRTRARAFSPPIPRRSSLSCDVVEEKRTERPCSCIVLYTSTLPPPPNAKHVPGSGHRTAKWTRYPFTGRSHTRQGPSHMITAKSAEGSLPQDGVTHSRHLGRSPPLLPALELRKRQELLSCAQGAQDAPGTHRTGRHAGSHPRRQTGKPALCTTIPPTSFARSRQTGEISALWAITHLR